LLITINPNVSVLTIKRNGWSLSPGKVSDKPINVLV
jgi:hypothetical protein